MKTYMSTLRDVFDSDVVYEVPRFQRRYVWSESNQWEPLWIDVSEIADEFLSDSDVTSVEAGKFVYRKPHFFGAVVLKGVTSRMSSAKKFLVVDGQQRLTTAQLLLTALSDGLHEKGLEDISADARRLIENSEKVADANDQKWKIMSKSRAFVSFRHVMDAIDNDQFDEVESTPISECYEYFKNRCVMPWLSKYGDRGGFAGEMLLTVIAEKLQVVDIRLEGEENPFEIFEALNARGEPLSEWDKAKNYILYKADQDASIDTDQLYADYLERFDTDEWQKYVGSGVNSRRRTDVFLDYWLESKLRAIVDTRDVFRKFRSLVDDSPINLTGLCKNLSSDADYFIDRESSKPTKAPYEDLFHSRRLMLRLGAAWPLLMELNRALDIDMERERCFQVLDSYLMRRSIVGATMRSLNEVCIEILKLIPRTNSADVTTSIIAHLKQCSERRDFWPSDSDVKDAVMTKPVYRDWSQYRVRLVLEAVERAIMRGKRPGNPQVGVNLPIEHLMPQNRDTNDWPVPVDWSEDDEELREHVINTLGNLTLVDHGLNSKLGNRPWSEKSQILHDEDNLYINKELLNSAPSEWDEDAIDKRGRRLSDLIIRIWPRSDAVTAEIENLQR